MLNRRRIGELYSFSDCGHHYVCNTMPENLITLPAAASPPLAIYQLILSCGTTKRGSHERLPRNLHCALRYFLKSRTYLTSALISSSLSASPKPFILVLSPSFTPSLMALVMASSFRSAWTLASV